MKTPLLLLPPVELGKYDTTQDFEAAFNNLQNALLHASSIIKSEGFKDWMKHSEVTYGLEPHYFLELNATIADSVFNSALLYSTLVKLS